ncbi:MAG: GGDEF domain-containing protein [Gammaproteobacteria bacterium]|nr:GGDEF domain-containing protein [Gammaproteobacteria bacterium]
MNQLRSGFLAHYVNQTDVATMLQRHPDPILVTDEYKEIVYTNTAGARLLCRLPSNNGYLHREINQELNYSYIVNVDDVNGEVLSFDVNRTEIQWNNEVAIMYCLHDITTHKLYCNELEQLVYSDHMTGLYNSRGLEVLSAHVRSIATRNKQSITSYYIDVNNLKRINDDYGHSMGDTAIIETAEIINHCFRNADVSARVGGDEFVVLTLDDVNEPVDLILARLEKEIERRNTMADRCYELSVSVGVSRHPANHLFNVHQLIQEADHRMYVAKKQKSDAAMRQCTPVRPVRDESRLDQLQVAV